MDLTKFRGSDALSYSKAREIVLSAFEAIGLPRRDYGLHSLRPGGASAAANAHITDRLSNRHGRWKSDKAKDGYIKDNIASLLSVFCHWVFNLFSRSFSSYTARVETPLKWLPTTW